MSYLEFVEEKKELEEHIHQVQKGEKPKPLFCSPNCEHDHHHIPFQDDFTKNYKDPLHERPGICFLEGLENAPKYQGLDNPSVDKGLGALQTPINLETKINILENFVDDEFKFNYEKTSSKALKFNDQGDAFFWELNAKKTDENK